MVAYWGFKPMNTQNRKVHLQVVTILLDVSTYPNSFHCAKSQQLRARASLAVIQYDQYYTTTKRPLIKKYSFDILCENNEVPCP